MSTHVTPTEVPDDIIVIPDAGATRVVDLTQGATELLTEVPSGVRPRAGALRHYRALGAVLALIDVLCLAAALLAAHGIRFASPPDRDYVLGMFVSSVLWVGVFHALGLYAPQHLSGLEEFRRTVSAVGIGVVLVILLTFWLDVYLSRSWIALTLIIALVLEVTARGIVRARERRIRAQGSLVLRTVVVGSRKQTPELETLDLRGSGFVPVGFVDITSRLFAPEDLSAAELVARLRAVLRRHEPDCVLVASPTIGTKQMVAVLRAAHQEGVLVRVYTHLSGIFASRLTVQAVGEDAVVLTLRPAGLTPTQRIVKRGMDLVLAGIGLIVASPILLLAALAIKTTSRGPVLFRQERVTAGARIFGMYKLRTMTDEADRDVEQQAIDTSAPFFKLASDPRLTKVGRWLRRWSIDELPQLFNVLLGDISLVGPRPLPADQVAANFELLGPRHEVRAGITGWWQIQGRSEVDPEEAIRMDHFYIENWSPALDLYIQLRTVAVLFTRRGAY